MHRALAVATVCLAECGTRARQRARKPDLAGALVSRTRRWPFQKDPWTCDGTRFLASYECD